MCASYCIDRAYSLHRRCYQEGISLETESEANNRIPERTRRAGTLTFVKFATVGASEVMINLAILPPLKVWLAIILANTVAVELNLINSPL